MEKPLSVAAGATYAGAAGDGGGSIPAACCRGGVKTTVAWEEAGAVGCAAGDAAVAPLSSSTRAPQFTQNRVCAPSAAPQCVQKAGRICYLDDGVDHAVLGCTPSGPGVAASENGGY